MNGHAALCVEQMQGSIRSYDLSTPFSCKMPTRASTSLNRILRVTVNLLFEKGESVQAIANLMQGFVDRRMIQEWHEKYCEINGISTEENSSHKHLTRKIPVAPIDFEKVTLDEFEKRKESNWDDF